MKDLKDFTNQVYFGITDHFDVFQFKVVSQSYRGDDCIQLETEIIGQFTSQIAEQHEFYYKKLFVTDSIEGLCGWPVQVFENFEDARAKAIALIYKKLDQIDQERQDILIKIENIKLLESIRTNHE